jgi:hypothetical protein
MDPSSFSSTDLMSLCVPAAVESFGRGGSFPWSLQSLTFELGSRLRRFASGIFEGTHIGFVFIPPSLEAIHGRALFCRPRPIIVDPGNTHFTVVDRTLMNTARTSVIHHFGDDPHVALDSTVEELGIYSFAWSPMTAFNCVSPSRLRLIDRAAFFHCSELGSIVLPPSVEVIEQYAFNHCHALQQVVFATGSKLRLIEYDAFIHCGFLQPVDVPASTKMLASFKVLAELSDRDGSRRIRVRFYTPGLRL